jgi:hypothetical protein
MMEKFEIVEVKFLCDCARKMREFDGAENTTTDERSRSSVAKRNWAG